jgi:thioredoxin-dependent peroxiredoxin
LAQFCAKDGLTFKLLDPDTKVVEEYGSLKSYGNMTLAARSTFLIDPQGKIAKVWTVVDLMHHSEESPGGAGRIRQDPLNVGRG